MFRNLNEDDSGGFVNEGLEICEENGKAHNTRRFTSPTKIEITRSKYDQQQLNDEMMYNKKPQAQSSEYFVSLPQHNVFKRKARQALRSRTNAVFARAPRQTVTFTFSFRRNV